MRRSILVLTSAMLAVSCEFPERITPTTASLEIRSLGQVPDLDWQMSTTNVPMFVMGTYNGLNVIPLDINDAGQIIGILRSPQPPFGVPDRAFRWENGAFTDLGPALSPSTIARAINTSGFTVGNAGLNAATWTSTTATNLPQPASSIGMAFGVNDLGDVVGANGSNAVRWLNGAMQTLPKPTGSSAIAFDINSNGTIAGRITATSPPFGRPMLWQNGVMTQILPPTGSTLTNPHAFQSRVINEAGEWMGNLQTGGTIRGFRRRNGAFETLPVLFTTASQSWAIGIGEDGDIVGASPVEDGSMHAVIWDVDNVIKDLGLVPGASSTTANAVNRDGVVVGTAVSVVNGVATTVGVIWLVGADVTPPEIAPTVEGTLGTNGWYTSDVSVTWNVSDNESNISSSNGCETQNVVADVASVTFTCAATNGAGLNSSRIVVIKRDASPPAIATTVEGTMGLNGWYTSNVVVSQLASDAQSEVATSSGCDVQTLASDTPELTYTCSATNGAGLVSTNSVTVKRDATAPVISFSLHPAMYDIDDRVSITCTASDPTSGLASSTCSNIDALAYTLALGSQQLSAQATDNAGNASSASTSFKVGVTLAGLTRLTQSLVTDGGVANALISKLDAAAAAMERGNERTVQNLLGAYVQQVGAQAGKKVSAEDAALLQTLAGAVQQ